MRRKHKHEQNHPSSVSHFEKLLRREVIWIQCFHRPNNSKCGNYLFATDGILFACVIICLSGVSFSLVPAQTQDKRKHKKKDKKLILITASRPFSREKHVIDQTDREFSNFVVFLNYHKDYHYKTRKNAKQFAFFSADFRGKERRTVLASIPDR